MSLSAALDPQGHSRDRDRAGHASITSAAHALGHPVVDLDHPVGHRVPDLGHAVAERHGEVVDLDPQVVDLVADLV